MSSVIDGSYLITGIDPGTWTVREVGQPGWTCSFPNPGTPDAVTGAVASTDCSYSEDFDSNEDETGNDFGNWTTASKAGRKFHDLNADGDDEGGADPGEGGWTIYAYADDGDGVLSQAEFDAGPVTSDATLGDGSYTLSLDPSDYIVCEVLQLGWMQSHPVAGSGDCSIDSSLGAEGYAITVTSGQDHEDNDFGNFPLQPGVGTPGFWLNHPEVWDGDPSNDGAFSGKVNFPPGDILYQIIGETEDGILIGDWNMNGMCDEPDGCIFLSVDDALEILASSQKEQSKDKRLTLARQLIAAWLNVIAGNNYGCIEDAINDGIEWLLETTASGPGDGNPLNDPENPVKGRKWSNPFPGTVDLPAGEVIYDALDEYNNTGGTCALDRDIQLEVKKSWSLTVDIGQSGFSEGDTLTYTYQLKNTEVADVTNVSLNDPHSGLSPISCDLTSQGDVFVIDGTDTLNPNESVTCSATYVVTVADIGGLLTNTATAMGFGPNGHTLMDADTVTLTPPLANDDAATTDEDIAVLIDVAVNDSDAGGDLDLGSISITSGPSNGSLEIHGDGTITYTPNLGFSGGDSFEYQICDGDGLCDVATVTITVDPVP